MKTAQKTRTVTLVGWISGLLIGFSFAFTAKAEKPLQIVTTTTTLGHLVERIGGKSVEVVVLGKGTQDPHYLEAKPSYMVKLRQADLVVAVGMDLETGWLPNVLRGARNPQIQKGQKGYLELGPSIEALEKPVGRLDRAEGDIHPFGNPHFYLDPIRYGEAGLALSERLSELRPDSAESFKEAARGLKQSLIEKTDQWSKRVQGTGVTKVITYHRTLSYFLNRFGMVRVDEVEAKPGIPPSAKHLMELIKAAQEQKVGCILHESFFEQAPSLRVANSAELKVAVVATEVKALPDTDTFEALIDQLVRAVESCRANKGGV